MQKRKIYNERIEFTMPVPQNYKKPGRISAKSLVLNQLQ
ncbi:GntR family transcriptional regulator, partial [Bacillus thuringiensis]|nr:GntR family transcriptional regulator [Bacillus thuringiensis]